MRDIVIIGAGPAGALTGARLAAHGHDVVVLEEHHEIGAPVHCTGLLGFEAFDEFDLPRSLILANPGAARFSSATGQSVRVSSDRITAAVIDRQGLDRWLVDRAVQAGADVRCGARAEQVTVHDRHVSVTVRDEAHPIEARAVVLACGANYRFHRALGLGLPDVFLQSAQVETSFADMPDIEVQFGREVAPAGFAWMVPFKRGDVPYARIGLMSQTRAGDRFASYATSIASKAGVEGAAIPDPRQKMLPLGPVRKTYASRVVAIGDAAGLVKPTTGGGIYYGLLSGSIAADVLHAGLLADRLSERYLSRYETRWKRRLGNEIRVGLAFRQIVTRLNDESIEALIDLARVDGIVPLLQQTASFNWHRKAAVALLGHPAFRRIVFRSWTRSVSSV